MYESPRITEVGTVRDLTQQNLFQGLHDSDGWIRGGENYS
ncbi:lasso RiPP family leader peptide-containing protein [Isoptericola sp. NEAU-Y5]|uniref:Lasso RiPP family leader peptide-containing protein n=1 Tax=Isoptericola luteus TaxID=2879484 RepID=A0ABS7ZGZ0_9MICO|nr:lasso RiPP family leader peptide-containing protein [Isoptericola sp. NEAU-Y5]MCA5892869.1 lasso RiPP family leader peptide-containing protein [Isoptericola sp. NEAU-Y5]